MDTNRLWEDHVEKLTKKYSYLISQNEALEERVSYLENVVLTLIVALKSGGVIQDASDSDKNTYEV